MWFILGSTNKHSFYVATNRELTWGGRRRWLKIVIYDYVEDMYKDASRYSQVPISTFEGAYGLYQPPWYKILVIPGQPDIPTHPRHYGGLIRLYKPKISQEVINHEAVHAAAAIWRMDVGDQVNLGNDCEDDEEKFAYMVGDLSAGITKVLVKADISVFIWNQ